VFTFVHEIYHLFASEICMMLYGNPACDEIAYLQLAFLVEVTCPVVL